MPYPNFRLLVLTAAFGMLTAPVSAQLVPDTTLGTQVTSETAIRDRIDGGTIRGSNLFHSFREFNVAAGREAYFANPAGISTIFTRVTGTTPSQIDGTLGVSGTASLFLLNPNGILFGKDARLDLGGSFVSTTANTIRFTDGSELTANLTASPVLTQSAPVGLQFGSSPASIVNRSTVNTTGLQVPTGKSIVLAGGDIRLEGGRLRSRTGQIELASVAAAGTVGITANGDDLRLSFPNDLGRGNVSLSAAALVNVSGTPSGRIAVNAANLDLSGGSLLLSQISGVGAPESRSGNIDINVSDTINVTEASGIINRVLANTVGNAGDLNIQTGSLLVKDGSFLVTNTRGRGNAGQMTIQAAKTVSFDGVDRFGNPSLIWAGVNAGAIGNGGTINLTAESLSLREGAYIANSTIARGNAGSIHLQAKTATIRDGSFLSSAVAGGVGTAGNLTIQADALSMSNGAFLSTGVVAGSIGNGGELNITANALSVTDGASLVSSTSSRGNAGTINLRAKTAIFSGQDANGDSAFVSSAVAEGGIGTAGDLNITADALFVANGAFLSTATLGKGNGGTMNINANTASFDGYGASGVATFATSAVNGEAEGNGGVININANALSVTNGALLTTVTVEPGSAGDINVTANTLDVLNGGQILSTSFGAGKAGTLTFNVRDRITLSGSDPMRIERSKLPRFDDAYSFGAASGLYANTVEGATGAGGDLRIQTGQLLIQNGASVSVSKLGTGDSGNLIVAADSIRLSNAASLRAESRAGSQGNISLTAGDIVLRQGSTITTDASGKATGGNITIEAPVILGLENSDISANAVQGQGGSIQITTQGIFGLEFRDSLTPENDITASSQFGINGSVEINRIGVDPGSGMIELPATLSDPSQQIATACSSDTGSRFVMTGRGGVPESPSNSAASSRTWTDLRERSIATHPTSVPAARSLVEASNWRRNTNGKIELITAQTPRINLANCANGF